MDFKTIRYELADGILTITLNRPDQLNAFTPQMAAELIDAFRAASADDAVKAIIVTGAGRAYCAGMDLSAVGNVFGLDEQLQPTLADMHDRLRGSDDRASRARHGRARDPRDLRLQQAGHRCDQRRGGRHRRDDDAGDGYPPGIRQGAHRFRVRQDRHRAGGVLVLVPAAHRRHPTGAGMGVHARISSTPRKRSAAAW